ncbi:hypothetical protein LZ32DRAFT_687664 [Colletotrichum eremochloae]|nr:hypothetical protein LZ32DRAFT_687664 [Colletotrichum eremochloae]
MTLLMKRAPLVWTQPDLSSPTAYQEDEFVSLWCDMYSMLLKLNFWKREVVKFPPADTGRHTQLCSQYMLNEKGLSWEAVSLTQRPPYPRVAAYRRMRIYPEADAISYLETDDIRNCRDQHDMAQYSVQIDSSKNSNCLLPQDVALPQPDESDGPTWVLDLDHSMYIDISPLVLDAA